MLEDTGVGKYFLNRTPIAQEIIERIDKWDFIKLKSFCTSREIITTIKRQPTEWEKICTNYLTNKR
jgi:hypothetical protein